jgi:Leucine-rich repeat (LRR) protein
MASPFHTNSSTKAPEALAFWKSIGAQQTSTSEELSNAAIHRHTVGEMSQKLQQQWSEDIYEVTDDSLYSELGNAASTAKSEDQSYEQSSTLHVQARTAVGAEKLQATLAPASAVTITTAATTTAATTTAATTTAATTTAATITAASIATAKTASSSAATVFEIQTQNRQAQEMERGTRQSHPVIDISQLHDQSFLNWTRVFLSLPESSKLEFTSIDNPAWIHSLLIQTINDADLACKPGKQVIMTLVHPVTDPVEFGNFCTRLAESKLFSGVHVSGDRTLHTAMGIKTPLVNNPGLRSLELSNVGSDRLCAFFSYLGQTSLTDMAGGVKTTIVMLESIKLTGCTWSSAPELYAAIKTIAQNLPNLKELDLSGSQLSDQQKGTLRIGFRALGKEHILKL